ncbi:hypothetical protein N7519_001605 [Penicillium mononematosum]|uniref:uncharacterized protein n=1 Tax=Penicillium mononematosum TaxID=268346 RepID=UPI0025480123|nr:uncharacterized protein N7519_001605 [Penicillium mononematosum]KAJ6191584.1 hypothetical protein N7519_001605 [Penicillium mononematosum]
MDYPTRRSSRFQARQVFARANFPLRAYGPRRGMALLKIGLFGTVGYFVAKKLLQDSNEPRQNPQQCALCGHERQQESRQQPTNVPRTPYH